MNGAMTSPPSVSTPVPVILSVAKDLNGTAVPGTPAATTPHVGVEILRCAQDDLCRTVDRMPDRFAPAQR